MKTSKITIRSLYGISEQVLNGASVEITGKKGAGVLETLKSVFERNERITLWKSDWTDYHSRNLIYVGSINEIPERLLDLKFIKINEIYPDKGNFPMLSVIVTDNNDEN